MKNLEERIDVASSELKGFIKKKDAAKPTEEAQKPQPTFIQVGEPTTHIDTLKIFNANPAYVFRWCQEGNVSNGRSGEWYVVDRNHPDFKGLRAALDHSPEESFIKFKDLILCCVRKETAEKKRQLLSDRTKARSRSISERYKTNVGKIQKSLGNQSEAIRLMDEINEEE